jgi:hypothetical protein
MGSQGISHSSIFKAIWRIVYAINHCQELQIRFPTDHDKQKRIAAGFKEKSQVGFANCVGAINGLLIKTEKPTEKEAQKMKTGSKAFFCGRKGHFGFNMQAVCDANGKFLSVWIIHPASSSDPFQTIYQTPNTWFSCRWTCFFGDNAYVLTDYMVTPYKNVHARPKDNFNFFHSHLQISFQ